MKVLLFVYLFVVVVVVFVVVEFLWKNVNIGGGGGFVFGIVFYLIIFGVVYVRIDIGGFYRLNFDDFWIFIIDSFGIDERWQVVFWD